MNDSTKAPGARIWSFGGRTPTAGGDTLRRQLRLAHHYYNKLVTLKLERLQDFRDARGELRDLTPLVERVDALTGRIDAIAKILASTRKKKKGVPVPVPPSIDVEALRAEQRALSQERKDLRGELARERKELNLLFAPGDEELRLRVCNAVLAAGFPPILKIDGSFERFAPAAVAQLRPAIVEEMLNEPQWSEAWKRHIRGDRGCLDASKQARAASGLTKGTYVLTEDAVAAAFRPNPMRKGDPEPRKHFGGTGRVGLQVPCLPVSALFDGTYQPLQIRWTDQERGRATARMAIERGPRGVIYVELPVLFHRELPPDGEVRWAWILVRRVGPHFEYRLQLTIRSREWELRPKGTGVVAIDLGWRKQDGSGTPNGLRVGYAIDDRGAAREFLVPQAVIDAQAKASALRGHADDHFNVALATVLQWAREHGELTTRIVLPVRAAPPHMDPHTPAPVTAPREPTETLRQVLTHAHLWKHKGKLAGLTLRLVEHVFADREQVSDLWGEWKRERLVGGLDLFDLPSVIWPWAAARGLTDEQRLTLYLDFWRRKNRHLYEWQTHLSTRARRRRDDLFAVWARELARQYDTIVVEDFDLRKFSKRKPKQEEDHGTAMRRTRATAAPGVLRDKLVAATGKRVKKVPCEYSTRECRRCHHVNSDWQDPAKLVQQCGGCGESWDQDENAAYILRDRWASGQSPAPEGAPKAPVKAKLKARRVTRDAVSLVPPAE